MIHFLSISAGVAVKVFISHQSNLGAITDPSFG
jgi:hypothetical protein